MIIIPDETRLNPEREDWAGAGRKPCFARIEVPAEGGARRYRLAATIAMAEIDRQLGGRVAGVPRSPHRPLTYDRGLGRPADVEEAGKVVPFAELMSY